MPFTDIVRRVLKAGSASGAPEVNAAAEEVNKLIAQGQTLEDVGNVEKALALYTKAVHADPLHPRAHMNVGNALARMERWHDAAAAQQRAVDCAPHYAEARFNLGSSLLNLGEVVEAEKQLLEASCLKPNLIQAPILLADLYEAQERIDEAEVQFARALAIDGAHAGAMLNFGMFYMRQGRLQEGMEWFERARRVDPGLADAESSILFALNFRTDLDESEIAKRHRAVGALISESTKPPIRAWPNSLDPARRLRVGYVSGDFRVHPVAAFLRPVLEYHDPDRVVVHCYSNYGVTDSMGRMLRERNSHWLDISRLSDDQVIQNVLRDRIDILVDLSGHTNRNRLRVFARHPAPLQMTWLGYLNTTGLKTMDYRICDWHTDPPGAEEVHTERLIRMPHSQWCYAPWCPEPIVPERHGDGSDEIAFGSFNQLVKISDPCLVAWCRILERVPKSRLVILDVRQPALGKRLLERIAKQGIDPARIELRGREPIPKYLAAIASVDVALDTFPYNGATTTLDTLWMGVPLVALIGRRGISRGSYSILRTLGESDLIAHTMDQYIELNVRLASDPEWRHRLRGTLRVRLEASPLMDAASFVQALEGEYRRAWRSWCTQRSPANA